jgi:hypothetical protein
MTWCREPVHVDTDLGDHDLGAAFRDARDRVETVAGINERDHQHIDLVVETTDRDVEAVDVIQQFPNHPGMEAVEPSRHRPRQQFCLHFQSPLGQSSQHGWVAFAVDERFEHGSPGHAQDL